MARPLRIAADADDVGRGLGQLVVALLEIVRELLERQALRRADSGDLDDVQIERLGQALQALEERFAELRETFDPPDRPRAAADNPFSPLIEDFISGRGDHAAIRPADSPTDERAGEETR
ncbi:MAG: gas vesicle protein K [Micromonosporaceae bacterium]